MNGRFSSNIAVLMEERMTEVIGVRFKSVGKVYYFDPNGNQVAAGDSVIVETARGVECGKVVLANREVEDDSIVSPLKPVIRIATKADLETVEKNKKKEREAFDICLTKIEKHKLDMKLVDVEYTFDNNKILFYFTADGRVDFRELVKDLASVFKTRIELRQIGVRDEAKMLGGLGICGRPFCCASFLGEFQPVSIKMAKEQSLSLSPTKISGTCGRLMCCLKYEQNVYDELLSITPKVGALVKTPEGKGHVIEVNILTGALRISLDDKPDAAPRVFDKNDVVLLRDSQIRLNKDEIDALKSLEDK
jgi:cell fate regulator YaaT (PSP1 superfamily)